MNFVKHFTCRSFICATCLFHMYDTTHSHIRHASSISVTWHIFEPTKKKKVGNTVKRVVVIIAGTVIFNKPLTQNGIIGSSVAIGGVSALHLSQCVAVCCSVLQCVAVCCSVLQCVAVCCSVSQCVAVCCSHFQQATDSKRHLRRRKCLTSVAICCSALQCVAVRCSVLQSFPTSH